MNTLKSTHIDFTGNATEGNCLEGNTLIMAEDGSLYRLEDLAEEYNTSLNVACVDSHGRLTTSYAHSFRIGQWTDVLYHITFSNGHKVKATENHEFLTASGDWIEAKDLRFSSVLKGAVYDPRFRNPLLALNEVIQVHIERLPEKIPMYDFTVDKHENLFIAQEVNDKVSLIVAHNSTI